LLAVSGGVDSVVMTHLFIRAGIAVGMAHCNFQLRGPASDGDEDFVRDLAEEYGAPVDVAVFKTREEAERRGISVQMAARELRYDWMEELRQRLDFDRIATGHQLDDSVETVLYNFLKGTGLRGLHGIPLRRGPIIRPLLFATKAEILDYAKEHGLSYREDATNAEEIYARNKIRHQVLPVFRDLNPGFERTAAGNLGRLREAEYLFDWALERIRRELVREEEGRLHIDLEGLLLHYRAAPTILYEILKPFHFHSGQVPQILGSVGRQPGALFFSETHQLLVDRETLIIQSRLIDSQEKLYYIAEQIDTVFLPNGKLTLAWKEGAPAVFPADPLRAVLDAGSLEFPLRLRHWRAGDHFYPLGMKGQRQKLQDFFTNLKIPRLDKDRIWLLENGDGRICWVIGYRPDERFKVVAETRRHLELAFKPF
jgi:tRNA(Ile)-lysidine synthase